MAKTKILDAESKVTLIFAMIGAVIGVISGIIDTTPQIIGLIALLFFYVSFRVAPRILNLEETSFEPSAWNLIKAGGISYWFILLVFWTLVHTLGF